jgi:acyl-CoA synthetase (AMP-forming)/AMP-acid ligase II
MKVLVDHGQPLPGVKRAMSAGAPVPPDTVARVRALLPPEADFWTPYGATECLPVAVVEGRTLEATRAATEGGAGTCVGDVVAPNLVRIIAITDAPIAHWSAVQELAPGQIGEITVAGPTATDAYFNRPQATAAAKITETLADGSTRIVHRMGDVGYFDAQGRLWFCGRKTQRVETAQGPLYTEKVEPVFNTVAGVRRTALVGIGPAGAQRPVLCYELEPGVKDSPAILAALRTVAGAHPPLAGIADFLCHRAFPVDIRHNAKIGREKLAVWAAARLEQAR